MENFTDGLFDDETPKTERRFRSQYTGALIVSIDQDKTQPNTDFFPSDALIAQGLAHETKHNRFHKAIFSEYAYWNGKCHVAIQEKRGPEKPWHLQEEYIMKNIPFCTPEQATRLSQAWTNMNFDVRTVRAIIHGQGKPDQKAYKHGLKREENISRWVDYFEGLAFEMEIADASSIDHFRIYAFEEAQKLFDSGFFPEEMTLQDFAEVRFFIENKATLEYTTAMEAKLVALDEETNDEDASPDFTTSAFTGRPLQSEADRCPYVYIQRLREKLQERPHMVPQFKKDLYFKKGDFRWLRPSQISELWDLVKSL